MSPTNSPLNQYLFCFIVLNCFNYSFVKFRLLHNLPHGIFPRRPNLFAWVKNHFWIPDLFYFFEDFTYLLAVLHLDEGRTDETIIVLGGDRAAKFVDEFVDLHGELLNDVM